MTPLPRAAPSPRPEEREPEFAFSEAEFKQIAHILYAHSGIALAEHKMPLVYGRLVKRLRALGLETFHDYCALVGSRGGVDERQRMVAALTTNVTRFMREPHHFAHLRDVVLPPLLDAARRGARVRIWSAGCSSGPEPYSVAMTVLGLMPDAADRDIRILATDIDPGMIAIGRAGTYADDVVHDVPKAERLRWFAPSAGGGPKRWTVAEPMRRLVAFRELNLMGEWPMRGPFDVIFCRNVVIYFDEATQGRIWGRYADLLRPGGLLCVGHSERVSGPARSLFDLVGPTIYLRQAPPR